MASPTLDTQVSASARRLRLAAVPLVRQLRQQAIGTFTPTQLSVIGAIHRDGPIALGDLAARERLSPPTISKVVAALEDTGFIERIPDAQDRRVCRVRVTPSGQAWIERNQAVRDEWLAARIAALDPAERAALDDALPVLERLLGEPE